MIKHNQNGAVSFVVVFILSLVIVASIAFSGWAYSSREDYKNNVDSKISAAVQVEKQQESTVKDQQFAQEEKSPLTTYTGPQTYGSIVMQYPKTYSAYLANAGDDNNAVIDAYFDPQIVPAPGGGSGNGQASIYALRMQVLNQSYASTVASFTGSDNTTTPPTSVAYSLPKLPSVVGVMLTGNLGVDGQQIQTEMVVLPLRTQTILLWTEGPTYVSDFNNYVLPNFDFSP
jgi:hypothetical protein